MTIETIVAEAVARIDVSHGARERALAASRALTRQCANAIRAVHRAEFETAQELLLAKKSFWGGLEGQFLTDDLADLLNVPNNMSGYLVKSVAKDSPGERAGLRGLDEGQRLAMKVARTPKGREATAVALLN